jgi:Fe-S cluster assembly protein SufD
MMATLTKHDLSEQLESFGTSGSFPGASNKAFAQKRRDALNSFSKTGFPGRKDEEYKYSNIKPFLKGEFQVEARHPAISRKDVEAVTADLTDSIRLVLVNGVFRKDLSDAVDHKGFTISPLADAVNENSAAALIGNYSDAQDPYAALNTAIWTDGIMLHFEKNCILEQPVYIIYISTSKVPRINNPRLLVRMDEGASATMIEHYETIDLSAVSFSNCVSEIVLKENAVLHHYILQNECEQGVIVNSTNSCIDGKATYHVNTVSLNGAFVRNNLNIVLNHPYCEAHLFGLYLTDGNSLVDNHTLVDHRLPNCQSNELYKGIAAGNSTAVFNGKIYVRQDAQKTNAFQSNKNILLSDNASVNTKPQLEIYADDVKCSHGSTTGQLNEEAVFYLRARGLSQESAKRLMVQAFSDEVLASIKLEDFRNFVKALVTAKLNK